MPEASILDSRFGRIFERRRQQRHTGLCVEYDFAATSPGGIPGWPGAGELSVSHLCAVYTVRDGLIVAARDYRDRALA